MNRRFAAPPMIILMDVIVAVVFILLLDEPPQIVVEFIGASPPKGASIYRFEDGRHWLCDHEAGKCDNFSRGVQPGMLVSCPPAVCGHMPTGVYHALLSSETSSLVYEAAFDRCLVRVRQACGLMKVYVRPDGTVHDPTHGERRAE